MQIQMETKTKEILATGGDRIDGALSPDVNVKQQR